MTTRVTAGTTDWMPKDARKGETEMEVTFLTQNLGESVPLTKTEKEVLPKSLGEIMGFVVNVKNLRCCPHGILLGIDK